MRILAIRVYELDGETCADSLFAKGVTFALRMTGGGEPETWRVLSEAAALAWVNECPEQLAYLAMG